MHPFTIGAPHYLVTVSKSYTDGVALWAYFPGSSHNNGNAIGFCDGHAEHKRWTSPWNDIRDVDKIFHDNAVTQRYRTEVYEDYLWLAVRSSYLRELL